MNGPHKTMPAWALQTDSPQTSSNVIAFQSIGLPPGEAENKQTSHHCTGFLTLCILVLITQECLFCGVFFLVKAYSPPSSASHPNPRVLWDWHLLDARQNGL